jgi:hypothetical protein
VDYKTRGQTEPFEDLSDDFEVPELVRREEPEYKAESPEETPLHDFDSPEIADAFIDDKLDIVIKKMKEVSQAISKNYGMRKNYVAEIEDEIAQDRKELNMVRELNFQTSKILADRLRALETGIQNLGKRRRDTKEHFSDKIFRLKMEELDLMPEYLALKRIKGVLTGEED